MKEKKKATPLKTLRENKKQENKRKHTQEADDKSRTSTGRWTMRYNQLNKKDRKLSLSSLLICICKNQSQNTPYSCLKPEPHGQCIATSHDDIPIGRHFCHSVLTKGA